MRRKGGILLGLALAALPAAALAAFPADPPNDPLFDASPLPNFANEQWDLASPAAGFDRGISADRAWKLTTGRGAIVADIDLGVDLGQPDLRGRWLLPGHDFYAYDRNPTSDTRNNHGTNVGGVLGARADNGYGIAGIAPDARILPLRTSDNIIHQGARLAEALVYAADHGADAASMSVGADTFGSQLRRAVRYAYRRGVAVAVASGNEFAFHHHYPQVEDDVLAVGGVNPDTADLRDKDPTLAPVANDFTVHASYADYGPHLDLVAPTQVPTVSFGGGTDLKWSGTSAATPHVAGVATLVAARGKQLGLHLSAGEVIQILRMTADDLDDGARGYAPGWDLLSGWGRVNAFRAVSRARRGKVPPVADIDSPGWYRPATAAVRIRGTVSGRARTRWRLFLGRGEQPSRWRTLASGRSRPRLTDLARLDARRLKPGGYTLLLRARDKKGNLGEDRDFFYAVPRGRQRLQRGFPKFLGTSGEASPALADLNGDGAKDIVLATADGLLRVYDGRSGRMLPGWPRAMRPARGSAEASRRIGAVRSGFTGTPAIGDIAGGRGPEIVATGMDGRLYAWSARGGPVRGFPYRIQLHHPAEQGQLDSAIYSSPALADLSGGRKLEIAFGAADQRVYAVRGNGTDVPGWPVLARDGNSVAKILSSPAIGDLDRDRSPDVVIGTGEAYGTTPATSGRVYAFSSHGRRLPGWPVDPSALAANSIPLAGQGVPDSPSLADVDGEGGDEVAVAAFTGQPELYDGDGTRLAGAGGQSHFQVSGRGASSPASAPAVIALGANGAFGRLSSPGPLGFFGGAVDFRLAQAQLSPATRVPFEHLLGGWDAAGGAWLPAFPIPVEGWEIMTAPAIADVDGDGGAEVINGTGGNLLHAFSADGSEPQGWPKNAGGWLLASPAVGDVDGDKRLEVVDLTRDGYLFVWNTPTRARSNAVQWPSFRHDRRNSGRYRG